MTGVMTPHVTTTAASTHKAVDRIDIGQRKPIDASGSRARNTQAMAMSATTGCRQGNGSHLTYDKPITNTRTTSAEMVCQRDGVAVTTMSSCGENLDSRCAPSDRLPRRQDSAR